VDPEEKQSSGLSKLQDSDAETEVLAILNPMMVDQDQTNAISPTKLTVDSVKKTIFPSNFSKVNEFEPVKLRNSFDYDNPVKDKAKEKFANRSRIMPLIGNPMTHSQQDQTSIRNHYAQATSPKYSDTESNFEHQASVISVTEHRRRERGQPTIVSKLIFFEGVVYQIEEEVFSDSDHSSVYTSEDDFEVDRKLAVKYKKNNPLASEIDGHPDHEISSETGSLVTKSNVTKQKSVDQPRFGTEMSPPGTASDQISIRSPVVADE